MLRMYVRYSSIEAQTMQNLRVREFAGVAVLTTPPGKITTALIEPLPISPSVRVPAVSIAVPVAIPVSVIVSVPIEVPTVSVSVPTSITTSVSVPTSITTSVSRAIPVSVPPTVMTISVSGTPVIWGPPSAMVAVVHHWRRVVLLQAVPGQSPQDNRDAPFTILIILRQCIHTVLPIDIHITPKAEEHAIGLQV